jgi:hypothetical protein
MWENFRTDSDIFYPFRTIDLVASLPDEEELEHFIKDFGEKNAKRRNQKKSNCVE